MAAPTPPPLGGGRAAPSANVMNRFMNGSIGAVCEPRPGVKPMESFRQSRGGYPSGQDLLLNGAPPRVTLPMAEKLLSALASIANGDSDAARLVTNAVSVTAFRAMSVDQQTAVINNIWNAVTSAHSFTKPPAEMSDPEGDAIGGNHPLPTSVCPDRPGSQRFVKRLRGRPFREFAIGFRIDGGDQRSIDRVRKDGMTQQRLNEAFMADRRGLRLTGTVMRDQTKARVWTGNHDIFNESAVCVSRNFFGATAFPLRESTGTFYLWAVNCTFLPGFDTEAYQTALPGAKQWRPGEKAFSKIPATRVAAYVAINRLGAPPEGGWRVEIPANAAWNVVGNISQEQRNYINGELDAWKGGTYTIPNTFDFAVS